MSIPPVPTSCRGVRRRFPSAPLASELRDICNDPLTVEAVVPVRTARVVVANYRALIHDFWHVLSSDDFERRYGAARCPRCTVTRALCADSLDRWIVDQAAWVSLQQAERGAGVNTPIDHGPPRQAGFRPPRYGRALILPVDGPRQGERAAFLDIKGAGVGPGVVPNRDFHASGLEYLGIALADFFYGWIVDQIFARTVASYWTVPVYCVLDLGFDIIDGKFGTAPAGLHVRRACARGERGGEVPLSGSDEELVQLHMELLLRSYGVTTAGRGFELVAGERGDELHYYDRPVECPTPRHEARARELAEVARHGRIEMTNVQLARHVDWSAKSAQLLDFGHFHVRRRFGNPFGNYTLDGLFRVGRIVKPGDAAFIQPRRDMALDPDLFSRMSVNAYAFYVAQAFRNGLRMSSRDVEKVLRNGIARAFRRHPRRAAS